MYIIKDNITINIYLQSSDKITFTNYQNKLKSLLKIYNIKNYTIINLPKKIKRYTILRSPHLYIIKFLKYNIPSNINITFKLKNNVKTNLLQ